jgi:uncharacterized protein YegL
MRQESQYGVRPTGATGRVFPFYVVCDVSRSMWDPEFNEDQPVTPLNVVEDALPDMLTVLEDDPTAADTAHLGVIAFGDESVPVLPLTPLSEDPTLSALPRQTSTNYAEVFKYLEGQLRSDYQRLTGARLGTYTPVVFFLTDGNPQVDGYAQADKQWVPVRQGLGASDFPFRPVIVALGIGSVSVETVQKLRSEKPRGVACVAEGSVVPGDLLRAIMDSIVFSISKSVGQGDFQFKTPAGMRRLD